MSILDKNIGNNVALKEIITDIFGPVLVELQYYQIFVVDINIYYRLLKMVSENKLDSSLTKSLVPILGFWHPFKMACEKTQQFFLYTLIGPLLHTLFPTHTLLKKMKVLQIIIYVNFLQLSQILYIFNMLILSYPSWSNILLQTIQQTDTNTEKYSNLLANIFMLFQYILPVVC